MSVPSGGHEAMPPPPPPPPGARPAPPLSPDRVRAWDFSRSGVGRRGYNIDEVRLFLTRMAEELAGADREKAALRAEVRRLRNYYREHNVDVDGTGTAAAGAAGAGAGAGVAASNGPPAQDDGPTLAAISLMSQAQQAADAQVAQAEEYARRLVRQARQQYEDMLREAADQAAAAAERAGVAYQASEEGQAGGDDASHNEALERRIAWLRTFAEVTEVQLRSVLEALTREVDKLGDLPKTNERL